MSGTDFRGYVAGLKSIEILDRSISEESVAPKDASHLVDVVGDGNCMYRAIITSVLISGIVHKNNQEIALQFLTDLMGAERYSVAYENLINAYKAVTNKKAFEDFCIKYFPSKKIQLPTQDQIIKSLALKLRTSIFNYIINNYTDFQLQTKTAVDKETWVSKNKDEYSEYKYSFSDPALFYFLYKHNIDLHAFQNVMTDENVNSTVGAGAGFYEILDKPTTGKYLTAHIIHNGKDHFEAILKDKDYKSFIESTDPKPKLNLGAILEGSFSTHKQFSSRIFTEDNPRKSTGGWDSGNVTPTDENDGAFENTTLPKEKSIEEIEKLEAEKKEFSERKQNAANVLAALFSSRVNTKEQHSTEQPKERGIETEWREQEDFESISVESIQATSIVEPSKDEALEVKALEDEALEDEALEDEALEDEALEDEDFPDENETYYRQFVSPPPGLTGDRLSTDEKLKNLADILKDRKTYNENTLKSAAEKLSTMRESLRNIKPKIDAAQEQIVQDEFLSQAEISQAEASQGEASQGETSQAEASQGETSQGETSQGETSQGETSQAEIASLDEIAENDSVSESSDEVSEADEIEGYSNLNVIDQDTDSVLNAFTELENIIDNKTEAEHVIRDIKIVLAEIRKVIDFDDQQVLLKDGLSDEELRVVSDSRLLILTDATFERANEDETRSAIKIISNVLKKLQPYASETLVARVSAVEDEKNAKQERKRANSVFKQSESIDERYPSFSVSYSTLKEVDDESVDDDSKSVKSIFLKLHEDLSTINDVLSKVRNYDLQSDQELELDALIAESKFAIRKLNKTIEALTEEVDKLESSELNDQVVKDIGDLFFDIPTLRVKAEHIRTWLINVDKSQDVSALDSYKLKTTDLKYQLKTIPYYLNKVMSEYTKIIESLNAANHANVAEDAITIESNNDLIEKANLLVLSARSNLLSLLELGMIPEAQSKAIKDILLSFKNESPEVLARKINKLPRGYYDKDKDNFSKQNIVQTYQNHFTQMLLIVEEVNELHAAMKRYSYTDDLDNKSQISGVYSSPSFFAKVAKSMGNALDRMLGFRGKTNANAAVEPEKIDELDDEAESVSYREGSIRTTRNASLDSSNDVGPTLTIGNVEPSVDEKNITTAKVEDINADTIESAASEKELADPSVLKTIGIDEVVDSADARRSTATLESERESIAEVEPTAETAVVYPEKGATVVDTELTNTARVYPESPTVVTDIDFDTFKAVLMQHKVNSNQMKIINKDGVKIDCYANNDNQDAVSIMECSGTVAKETDRKILEVNRASSLMPTHDNASKSIAKATIVSDDVKLGAAAFLQGYKEFALQNPLPTGQRYEIVISDFNTQERAESFLRAYHKIFLENKDADSITALKNVHMVFKDDDVVAGSNTHKMMFNILHTKALVPDMLTKEQLEVLKAHFSPPEKQLMGWSLARFAKAKQLPPDSIPTQPSFKNHKPAGRAKWFNRGKTPRGGGA